jgi:GxxExxY protein
MHTLYTNAHALSKAVIGAGIEVHRLVGPGLARELSLQGIPFTSEHPVRITYKGALFEDILRCDFFIDGCLVVELKCQQEILPAHRAQILSYMRLLNAPLGLILNFYEPRLTDGIERIIIPGANE